MRDRRLFAMLLSFAVLAAACGGSPATVVPSAGTPAPPTATPNPHLTDPASVDDIYNALTKAGLQISPNSADAGTGGMVKRLHLTFQAWPLVLTSYTSAKALVADSGFNPKAKPILGDPPFALAGLNILIEYGSSTQNGPPAAPGPEFITAFEQIVAVVDPLIGPLQQQSVTAVPLPTPTPAPTASPGSSPSASPGKPTPKPTAKPKPKPTPKPTKKP
jgi:hypothetical protein